MTNHEAADDLASKLAVIIANEGGYRVTHVQPNKRMKPILRVGHLTQQRPVMAVRPMTTKWAYVHQEIRTARNMAASELDEIAVPIAVRLATDGELIASVPFQDLLRLLR